MLKRIAFCLLCVSSLSSATIPEKVLICGVAKNVERAIPYTIRSATALGSQFVDYRIIIYENNSSDQTKKLFQNWSETDSHVIFLSENVSNEQFEKELAMGKKHRTEMIARARNIVLDVAMQEQFDSYRYVVWADMDFSYQWDIENIVDTIVNPEQEWDAVFAYGAYDLFALRSPEWPVGFELVGSYYWSHLNLIRREFILRPSDPWKKVYSAFGGFGIYKREALRGCHYSGVVTDDLDTVTIQWLAKAREKGSVPFLDEYDRLLIMYPAMELNAKNLVDRNKYPANLGIRLRNGTTTWFSCTPDATLPWTCEHVTLHASMILKGHDRFFINPKIRSHP